MRFYDKTIPLGKGRVCSGKINASQQVALVVGWGGALSLKTLDKQNRVKVSKPNFSYANDAYMLGDSTVLSRFGTSIRFETLKN